MDGRRSAGPGKTIITEIYYTHKSNTANTIYSGSASGRWPMTNEIRNSKREVFLNGNIQKRAHFILDRRESR